MVETQGPQRQRAVLVALDTGEYDAEQSLEELGELAEAAGAFADYSIITSDNPDFEPPEDVIKEIASHMPEGAPYTCITDRRDAIRAAIGMAEDGDIILFAGKGHEDYQLIEGKKVHFVEREIIQEICREKQ